jgi:hypothetical protein
LAKHAGAYRSDKRRKEILRLKKQEEKRQRRLSKGSDTQKDTEVEASETEAIDSEGATKEEQN